MFRKRWTKAALALSICLFVLWWALGTTATLAWFSDADEVRNSFQIGLLDLGVSYRNDVVETYTPMESMSEVFNDEALYEPGYTQVVYLRIENKGNMDFQYKLAVTVVDSQNGVNAWGDPIYLPDYLRYGVVFGETEEQVKALVQDRLSARDQALNSHLDTWTEISPYVCEVEDEAHYAALVGYMPEQVGNVANYRGIYEPWVQLGITVFAQQENTTMN